MRFAGRVGAAGDAEMVATRLMTADELASLPEDGYQYELVRGELRRIPPPGWDHGRYCARIARPFFAYEDETGLVTVVTNATGFRLESDPDTVRGPDISVVLNSQIPAHFEGTHQAISPAVVAEAASPSEEKSEIEGKIADYIRAGILLVLYFFPATKTVWVDGAGRDRVVMTEADLIDCSDVLPGMPPVSIADIFR